MTEDIGTGSGGGAQALPYYSLLEGKPRVCVLNLLGKDVHYSVEQGCDPRQ